MPTPSSPGDPHATQPRKEGTPGYETTDVSVSGVLVFLGALAIFVAVFFVFCFGMGKVINSALLKSDGPVSKWNQIAGEKPLGNMVNNPRLVQQQLSVLTQRFPTPRLEDDDGNQEVADLHAREALLLDAYSWVDAGHTKVRIPIDRAMEIVAGKGLAVIAPEGSEPLLTGDARPVVTLPLTDGFAPTGYEQSLDQQMEPHGPRLRNGEPARGAH